MERETILSVRDLDVKFNLRGRQLHAIRGVSLDLYKGEVLAVVRSGLYLDFRLLALSREEFTQRAEMLVRSGEAERTGEGWRLTLAGENFLRKLDSDARKEIRETISTGASLAGAIAAARGIAA